MQKIINDIFNCKIHRGLHSYINHSIKKKVHYMTESMKWRLSGFSFALFFRSTVCRGICYSFKSSNKISENCFFVHDLKRNIINNYCISFQ